MEKLEKSVNVLAKNQEKFRTITIGKFQIRDSLEHMPSSLEALIVRFMQGQNVHLPSSQAIRPIQETVCASKDERFEIIEKKRSVSVCILFFI